MRVIYRVHIESLPLLHDYLRMEIVVLALAITRFLSTTENAQLIRLCRLTRDDGRDTHTAHI